MDNFNYKKYLKNNPLLAEEKKVGKLDWKFMSDDERMDALLSVVKDPDEAGKYIELDWDDLPSGINPQNMRIFEQDGPIKNRNLIKLLDSLSPEYGINDTRKPDGYPPKEGVKGYIVTDDRESPNQFLYFQHDRNTDEFTISRMSGFKIDEDEASRAGMRKGRSGSEAGVMVYMTDGNYTPTPISMDGLKRIIDHVMGGLDREAKAQSDFYSKRGHTSGTIDEGKRLFHYTIPKNEFGMTRMVIKAKDREEADKKIAAEYPDGGYEYKGKGAKFQYESLDEIELKYRSEDYILDYIANELFRKKYGRTISFDELTDNEQDQVHSSYDDYVDEDEPSGFYDKGMGVDE